MSKEGLSPLIFSIMMMKMVPRSTVTVKHSDLGPQGPDQIEDLNDLGC